MITDPNIPKKFDAVLALRPNGGFTVSGEGVVKYLHEGDPEPTEEQIQAKLAELQTEYDSKSYARSRQQNYPNEHDLLIALWEKVIEGRSESADALEVKRQEVKIANPKPK